MTGKMTYGRYPTLGEVRNYYSREDVLDFLLKACNTRRTVLVISKTAHWEPDWENNRVRADSVEELRAFLLEQIDEQLADVALDERPPFYPSLHFSMERWERGEVDCSPMVARDTAMESDLPTWRESFQNVQELIERLHHEGAPYRIKYSGRRSLHVLIPYGYKQMEHKAFPDFRGHFAGLLRVPYSLNEDTGMVSLPLTRATLSSFRPWQANLHLVEVNDDWLNIPALTSDEADDVFRRVRKNRVSLPVYGLDMAVDPLAIAERASQLSARCEIDCKEDESDAARAWYSLLDRKPIANEYAEKLLTDGSCEARWLTGEAFLLHGETPSHAVVHQLLRGDEPMLRSVALDILIRFPDVAGDYFAEFMQAEKLGSQAQALCLLNVSAALKDTVVSALQAVTNRSAALTIRLACVVGVLLEKWSLAWTFVEEGQEEGHGNAEWKTRVEALRLLEEFTPEWDPSRYAQIARKLGDLGSSVVDMLLLAYAKADTRLRHSLLKALAFIGDPSALDIFVKELGSNYQDDTRWATLGLMKVGAPAVPALIEAAQSDVARMRRYAVRCLGHLDDPRGKATLLAALDDSDDRVRGQATEMAVKYAAVEHIPALRRNLAMYDWDERHIVMDALRKLGDAGEAAIRDAAFIDGDPVAAGELWHEGDERGLDVLRNCITASRHVGRAIRVLMDSDPDPEVAKLMIAGSETLEWWDWRDLYCDMLCRDIPGALMAVLDTTRHPERIMRRMAAYALRASNDEKALAMLVLLLADRDSKTRATAYDSLVKRTPVPVAYLEEVAEIHENDQVRRAASRALIKFHGRRGS